MIEPLIHGGKSTTKKNVEPKSKTIGDVIKLIIKLNKQEKISAQHVQEWLKEIGLFFQHLNADNGLTAYLKDSGFSEEDKKELKDKIYNLEGEIIKLKQAK